MATDPSASPSSSLIDRVKNILTQPKAEWPRIDAEPATIGGIYRNYVLILAAIPPLAGAIGQLLFGYRFLGIVYRPSAQYVIATAVVQYVLALVAVYVLALVIDALAPTFGGTKDKVKAFKVAAYTGTAGWVAGIFGIIPQLVFLGLLGALYGLYLLYLGLPVLMKVSQDKAIGYVIATIVAAIVIYVIVGAIAAALVGAFVSLPGPAGGTLTLPG
jgi:hypothetical protein